MAESEVTGLLRELYGFRYTGAGEPHVDTLMARESWSPEKLWPIINSLEESNWIRLFNGNGSYNLTGIGAVGMERLRLVAATIAERNQVDRLNVMEALVSSYKSSQRHSATSIELLAEHTDLASDRLNVVIADCVDLGHADWSPRGARLSPDGARHYELQRQWGDAVRDFSSLSELTPQAMGRRFQQLLSVFIGLQGWNVEESVKASNEENDVLVFSDREDYLIECKWEKNPIEAGPIRELQSKLTNRFGTRGIFVSMSGFTSGAVEQAEEQANLRELLLFGREDVTDLIDLNKTFEQLLTTKHRQLVRQKKCAWH